MRRARRATPSPLRQYRDIGRHDGLDQHTGSPLAHTMPPLKCRRTAALISHGGLGRAMMVLFRRVAFHAVPLATSNKTA